MSYSLSKSKLRRLGNKMKQILTSATLEPYGHRIVFENGLVVYRDKKGWLHYHPPIPHTQTSMSKRV